MLSCLFCVVLGSTVCIVYLDREIPVGMLGSGVLLALQRVLELPSWGVAMVWGWVMLVERLGLDLGSSIDPF